MKVFCDIDGVLANFAKEVLTIHGLDESYLEKHSGKDVDVILEIERGLSKKDFYSSISSVSFWEHLDEYPEAQSFIESLEDIVGYENIFFLTSPLQKGISEKFDVAFTNCITGKMKWVHRYFRKYIYKTIVFREKNILTSNSFLIDDNIKNYEKSSDDGIAFLYSRPWNESNHDAQYILDSLRKYARNVNPIIRDPFLSQVETKTQKIKLLG